MIQQHYSLLQIWLYNPPLEYNAYCSSKYFINITKEINAYTFAPSDLEKNFLPLIPSVFLNTTVYKLQCNTFTFYLVLL